MLSVCQHVVHAGVKKLLMEHILSFVSSQNQLQKIFHDGSVMMKLLLCTYRDALCTLTTSTCAQKNRSWPETLIHGSARKTRLNAGKACTLGGRSAMLLGVLSRFISVTTFPFQMNRMRCSLLRSIVTALAMCRHSGTTETFE